MSMATHSSSNWREVPLGAVADIRFSNVDKKSEPGEEPVRLCNYTDVYNNDYVTGDMDFMRATATRTEIDRFGVQVGDVIITKDSETPNDIGVPTVIDSTAPDLVCGYHLAMIRPDPYVVDPTFLAKQLAEWRIARYFGQQANGTTRYGLSTASIANIVLHLPPVEQQRMVSQIIRVLDLAIAQTEAVIAKLKSVRAGLLHDLLTRGLDANGQLRPPPEQAPHLYKDSPLGKIPREWECGTLVDRISFPEGQVDPRICPYRDWVLIAPDHLESGTGRVLARQTAAEQGAISGKYIFEPNDVVYSKIRPYLCKAMLADQRGLCSADMYPLRPSECVNPRFLLATILGEIFTRFASSVSMRSGFPKINRSELAEFIMAWPTRSEQDLIAANIDLLDRQQSDEDAQAMKLCALKSGLMSDLLTVRVRVESGSMSEES